MAEKQETLERIRLALAGSATAPAPESAPDMPETTTPEMIERFCLEAGRVGAHVERIGAADRVRQVLSEKVTTGQGIAVSDGISRLVPGLRDWLAAKGCEIVPSLREFASREGLAGDSLIEAYKSRLIEADAGVTTADLAIADTGTLVLITGGEQHRMISLVPPVHVCVVRAGSIVADLGALIARASREFYGGRPPLAMTFITGPSRTADIELTLSLGVHGPRELVVVVVE